MAKTIPITSGAAFIGLLWGIAIMIHVVVFLINIPHIWIVHFCALVFWYIGFDVLNMEYKFVRWKDG